MKENKSMVRGSLAVIGGGYGGLCSAVMASASGFDVTVFERQDKTLKKLAITGNGRCNISNQKIDLSDYVTGDVHSLEKILSAFSSEKENAFFRELGLILRADESRLYPITGKASSVTDALRYKCNESGVTFICDADVTEVVKKGSKFEIRLRDGSFEHFFDRCILACGGAAGVYKENANNGYDIAKKAGHTVKPVYPALTKVICSSVEQKELKKLDGIRSRAAVSLFEGSDKFIARESGEVQFTATGLSGIPVFDLTRYMDAHGAGHYYVSVDLLPGFSDEDFSERTELFSKRTPETFFTGLLLPQFITVICERCGISIHKNIADMTYNELDSLKSVLHDLRFTVDKTGDMANAQISAGGVPLSEVDEHMGSKIVKGLYIIGEMLDVAGRCGGYNLHFAAAGAYNAVEGMKNDAENR